MYKEFFDLKKEHVHRLLEYLKSNRYSEETDTLYKESGFWDNQKKRTFVGVNNKAVMLYSGHNFVYDNPRKSAINSLLKFLSNYKCIVKYLQKISIKFDALSRRLDHFEKINSIRNFSILSYGKYEGGISLNT